MTAVAKPARPLTAAAGFYAGSRSLLPDLTHGLEISQAVSQAVRIEVPWAESGLCKRGALIYKTPGRLRHIRNKPRCLQRDSCDGCEYPGLQRSVVASPSPQLVLC